MADRLPCLAGTSFIIMSNYIECQCSKLIIKNKLFFVLELKVTGVMHFRPQVVREEFALPDNYEASAMLVASSIMCVVTIAASIS